MKTILITLLCVLVSLAAYPQASKKKSTNNSITNTTGSRTTKFEFEYKAKQQEKERKERELREKREREKRRRQEENKKVESDSIVYPENSKSEESRNSGAMTKSHKRNDSDSGKTKKSETDSLRGGRSREVKAQTGKTKDSKTPTGRTDVEKTRDEKSQTSKPRNDRKQGGKSRTNKGRTDRKFDFNESLEKAEAGDADSQMAVARHYLENGEYAEAAKWLKKAAKAGIGEAQFELGRLYKQGLGVSQDSKLAKRWLTMARDNGISGAAEELDDL